MAEEIRHDPPAASVLRTISEPYQLSLEETKRLIESRVRDLRRENPAVGDVIRVAGDLMLGPLWMGRAAVEGTRVPLERTRNGQIQHAYTEHLWFGSLPEADDGYLHRMRQIIDKIESLPFPKFWNGVRSEVGIVKAVQERGYHIALPDYVSNIDQKNFKTGEVYEWDVVGGTDFLVISPNNECSFLVDAKGRFRSSETHTGSRGIVDPEELPPSLANHLAKLNMLHHPIYQLTTVIPTKDDTWREVRGENATDREVVASTGNLSDILRHEIISEFDSRVSSARLYQ